MKYAKLSAYRAKKIVQMFSADIVASKAACLLVHNRKTVDHYYQYIRKALVSYLEGSEYQLSGTIQIDSLLMDESKDWDVIGLRDQDDHIIVVSLKDTSFNTFVAAIKKYVAVGSTIYTRSLKDGQNLSRFGYKHCEIGNTDTEFLFGKKATLAGIHSFRSYARRRQRYYNGYCSRSCYTHFKECEFRFKRDYEEIFSSVLDILKKFERIER